MGSGDGSRVTLRDQPKQPARPALRHRLSAPTTLPVITDPPASAPYAKQIQFAPPVGGADGEEIGRKTRASATTSAVIRSAIISPPRDFPTTRGVRGRDARRPAGLERVLVD